MATITLNATLQFDRTLVAIADQVVNRAVTPSGVRAFQVVQNVAITEKAINLGDISSVGWCLFRNLDPTNYIELRVATSGAKFATLHPDTEGDGTGGFALLYLGSGAQVPYAIANTGACDMLITACPQ